MTAQRFNHECVICGLRLLCTESLLGLNRGLTSIVYFRPWPLIWETPL